MSGGCRRTVSRRNTMIGMNEIFENFMSLISSVFDGCVRQGSDVFQVGLARSTLI